MMLSLHPPSPLSILDCPYPEKEAVAGMGGGIVGEGIAALFIAEDTRRILPRL